VQLIPDHRIVTRLLRRKTDTAIRSERFFCIEWKKADMFVRLSELLPFLCHKHGLYKIAFGLLNKGENSSYMLACIKGTTLSLYAEYLKGRN
jgi:hypothetical protein